MNKAPLIENLLELIEKNQFQKINKLLISNYKKSSAEGSCLNLKNTAELPLDLKICGNHFQEKINGYNLLEYKMATTTAPAQGVSVTNNKDGTWTLNGIATEDTTFRLDQSTQVATDNLKSYSAGDYTLFLGNWKTGLRLYVTRYPSYAWEMRLMDSPIQNGKLQGNNDYFTYLFITKGMTFNNYVVKPMLLKGTYTIDTIPTFEQFGQKPSIDFPSEITRVTGNVKNIIQNKNYYNITDKKINSWAPEVTIDNEDWITVDIDNSNNTSQKFTNFWTNINKILQPDKDYYVVFEIKNKSGNNIAINIIDNYEKASQFSTVWTCNSENLNAGDVLIKKIRTLSDFSTSTTMCRSYCYISPNLKGSVTFRISILSEEVMASKFVYTSYKNQIYQLPLGDKVLYGDENVRDYFEVKFDEDLYNCTGYKKITELKLIKNWNKYIFTGEENIFFSIVQGDYFLAQIRKTDLKRDTVIISNKFIYGSNWGTNYNVEKINSAYNQDPIIQFKILSSRLSEVSADGFKQFLAENNIYVVYQLNNPEEEIITDVKLIEQIENMINNIQSYAEETNISSDAFLKIDFYKDKVLELEERLEILENK